MTERTSGGIKRPGLDRHGMDLAQGPGVTWRDRESRRRGIPVERHGRRGLDAYEALDARGVHRLREADQDRGRRRLPRFDDRGEFGRVNRGDPGRERAGRRRRSQGRGDEHADQAEGNERHDGVATPRTSDHGPGIHQDKDRDGEDGREDLLQYGQSPGSIAGTAASCGCRLHGRSRRQDSTMCPSCRHTCCPPRGREPAAHPDVAEFVGLPTRDPPRSLNRVRSTDR